MVSEREREQSRNEAKNYTKIKQRKLRVITLEGKGNAAIAMLKTKKQFDRAQNMIWYFEITNIIFADYRTPFLNISDPLWLQF